MDHSECVPTDAGFTRAHTHEGQLGMWLFPSEATPRDLNRARATGWVPPAERPPARTGPDGYPGDDREPAWLGDPDRDDGEVRFAGDDGREP